MPCTKGLSQHAKRLISDACHRGNDDTVGNGLVADIEGGEQWMVGHKYKSMMRSKMGEHYNFYCPDFG